MRARVRVRPPTPQNPLQALEHVSIKPALVKAILNPDREVTVQLACKLDTGEVRQRQRLQQAVCQTCGRGAARGPDSTVVLPPALWGWSRGG